VKRNPFENDVERSNQCCIRFGLVRADCGSTALDRSWPPDRTPPVAACTGEGTSRISSNAGNQWFGLQSNGPPDRIHFLRRRVQITFALMVSIAVYVILDYEFPRVGFIRIDPLVQVLVETLKHMQ
jgi:hypothetical protein